MTQDAPCLDENCERDGNHAHHGQFTGYYDSDPRLIEGTYDAALEGVAKSIVDTVLERHRAYGHNLLRHGERGILIRVDDKTERISNLLDRGISASGGETISETWIDIAGYAIQAIMIRQGTFNLPMREVPHGET